MVATTLPAVVRVVDLPLGTTITGAELLEVVQTTAGVGVSVQVSIGAAFTSLGGVPTGGATGTILNKSSGSNYSTQFSAINTFVNVGTSLATTGLATSIVVFVPNQGITSTQLLNNAVGTNQIASSLGIASSLSVGTILTVGGTATVTGTTFLNGGLQVNGTTLLTGALGVVGTSQFTGLFDVVGTSQFTGSFNVAGTSLLTGNLNITGNLSVVGTSLFTGTFGQVGTSLMTGVHGVVGTTLFTSGAFGVVGTATLTSNLTIIGTATFTGNFGLNVLGTTTITGWLAQVGTSLMTGQFGIVGTALFTSPLFSVVGTSQFTGSVNIVGTTSVTGSLILGTQATGLIVAGGTGVVTATTTVPFGLFVTPFNAGSLTAGTFTANPLNANYQYLTNNGAFTFAAYTTSDYAIDVLVQNGTAPGNITFSGWRTNTSNIGDAYTTTARLVASAVIATASPGLITCTAHAANVGDPVWFSTSGSLPTGMSSSQIYYISTTTVNTFTIATAAGNTTGINLTGAQSGTQTSTFPSQFLFMTRSLHFVPTYVIKALQ